MAFLLMTNKHSSFSGKRCNRPPVLSTIEQQRLDGIMNSLVKGDFFPIKEVLESTSFHRCFKLSSKSMASSGGDDGKDIPTSGATPIAGDEGESHHSRDDHRRGDNARDDSVEFLGTIRKEMRRILLRLPDLTLLRLQGKKFKIQS